jgi:molecular chaperone DnaK
MKALANEKVALLQSIMTNPAISLKEFQQCLEDFQQTLFAIGANVYERASGQSDGDDQIEIEAIADGSLSSDVEHSMNGTLIPQFNFDFDEESTAQADYEAID